MAAPKKKGKEVIGTISLTITGAAANPSPPVGPALGQKGVNIMEFCKAFNDKTAEQKGIPIPVLITVYKDKSFTFITKTPPASYYLKQAAKLQKGSATPGRESAGIVRRSQLRTIARAKAVDLNAFDEEAGIRIIAGSARAMGLEVVDDE
jgi:large subunit ribosomal protein L11